MTHARIHALSAKGLTPEQISRRLKCTRAHVYYVLYQFRDDEGDVIHEPRNEAEQAAYDERIATMKAKLREEHMEAMRQSPGKPTVGEKHRSAVRDRRRRGQEVRG